MTTVEYLSQILKYDRMMQNKLEESRNLRILATGTTAPSDGDRVQTSKDPDKMGGLVAQAVDLENEVRVIAEKRNTIVKQIEQMHNLNHYDVLAQIYISGKGIKEVKLKTEVSARQIVRLHRKALTEFESQFGYMYTRL